MKEEHGTNVTDMYAVFTDVYNKKKKYCQNNVII